MSACCEQRLKLGVVSGALSVKGPLQNIQSFRLKMSVFDFLALGPWSSGSAVISKVYGAISALLWTLTSITANLEYKIRSIRGSHNYQFPEKK